MHIPFGLAVELLQTASAWFGHDHRHGGKHEGDTLISRSTVRHIDEIRQRWGVQGMAVAVVASPRFKIGADAEYYEALMDDDGEIREEEEGLDSLGGGTMGKGKKPKKPKKGKKTTKTQLLSFGKATNAGDALDPDSLFCIASNSKLFTALSVFKMIEDNVTLPSGEPLSLATKVKDVLPDWKIQDEYASEHADIADLMCE